MPWYHLLMVGMICLFIKEALYTSDTVICASAGFLHNQMGFTSRPRWIFTNRCLVSEWLSEVHWNDFSQNATLHQSSCVMNCEFLVCFAWSILNGTDQARALKTLCYDHARQKRRCVNDPCLFQLYITSEPSVLWAARNSPILKLVWEWPPDPRGPGPLSFENIPRAGPKIGTLGTPRGSHGTNFFLQNFSHGKLFMYA